MAMVNAKALMTYQLGGRPAANVMHVVLSDTDFVSPIALATQLAINWATEMHGDATAGACTFTGCRVTDDEKTWQAEYSVSVAGTAAGQMSTPAAAYLVRYALAGTTITGRSYLPGVPEAAINDFGIIGGTTAEYIRLGLISFWGKMEAEYPSIEQTVKMKPGNFRIVTGRALDPQIATQRRRLRK